MPTTSSSPSTAAFGNHPANLLSRLGSTDAEIKLKALREVKNQIIGNRTKKLAFIKLGVVPAIASIVADSAAYVAANAVNDSDNKDSNKSDNILVQSAAALGSFACGFDAGVQAVLDSGAFSHLLRLLSNRNEKVVDAGARSLRMIYQSKLAPEYDFLQEKNMEFLLSLLNSDNENVSGLGASIITHSCGTSAEQNALYDAGVLKKLTGLLEGSLSQRDASLESLAAIFKNNSDVITRFMELNSGRFLSSIVELAKDRYARTRLLACMCLIVIRNTSPGYLQDTGSKTKLIHVLLELLDEPGPIGDEASFAFSSLIAGKEDLQKLALEVNAIDRLYNHIEKRPLQPKRFEGLLLALADMCSMLEICRSRFLSLEVLNVVTNALSHDSADVRTAACICLQSVTRSIKKLSAGCFMNEAVVAPLIQLLHDPSTFVQVAALGAVSNIVVDFAMRKLAFIQCGGVKQLIQLSKSMDSTIRLNALWALRNLIFLADNKCKEGVFSELTAPLLASLISDPEPPVQEQALAFARNLVDGSIDSIEYVFSEGWIILNAVVKQLQNASKAEIGIQGMYVLTNVASGNELHKEAVMHQLLPQPDEGTKHFILKFLQSSNSQLRTATVWLIINLTSPSSPTAVSRHAKLRNAGIISQIKNMGNDPCLDVKLRVRTAILQSLTFGDA